MSLVESQLTAPMTGFWTWDIKRDWVFGEANLAQYFGLSMEQVAAGAPLSKFLDAIHLKDRASVAAAIQRSVNYRTPFRAEYRVRDRNQQFRTILAIGNCYYDEKGIPSFFPGWFMDTTGSESLAAPALKACAFYLEQAHNMAAEAGEGGLAGGVQDLIDDIHERISHLAQHKWQSRLSPKR